MMGPWLIEMKLQLQIIVQIVPITFNDLSSMTNQNNYDLSNMSNMTCQIWPVMLHLACQMTCDWQLFCALWYVWCYVWWYV
jgi:hypothetical protein